MNTKTSVELQAYKHLFFDLDNTLWDFRSNAHEAFHELFREMDLFSRIPDFTKFLEVYEYYNELLWTEYRRGRINKEAMRKERMLSAFRDMGIDDPGLAEQVAEAYLRVTPRKTRVFPQVHETLEYLAGKYRLYILTNGFSEQQLQKISSSGLRPFFSKLFFAEMAGYQKPDRRFFEYAVKSVHAHKNESLMIGDDPEADVQGAAYAGIDQVFFNPGNRTCAVKPTWEIRSFGELKDFL